jgi:hypothetical protein
MPLLDKNAFGKTWTEKMVRVDEDEAPPFDFWPYIEEIPSTDYAGFDCSEGNVSWAWRTSDGKFEHILISAKEDKDVSMVIILDRAKSQVVGHHLLDLKREYGLRE